MSYSTWWSVSPFSALKHVWFLAGITWLVTNNLPVTFHVHLQCISWIVLCVTFLWASLRHSVALHKTFVPTKKSHCKMRYVRNYVQLLVWISGGLKMMIHKTWYIKWLQELTRILISFNFEQSFNKCPFSVCFWLQKMFSGHLWHVKKNI